MKKIIALLLACVMVLGLFAACAETTDGDKPPLPLSPRRSP